MTDEKVEIENITEAFDYIRSNVPDEIAEQIIDAIRSFKKESFPDPEGYLNLECKECGHEWTVEKSRNPEVCPKCESPHLDQEVQKPNPHSIPEDDIIWEKTLVRKRDYGRRREHQPITVK